MELYVEESEAAEVIAISESFNVPAQIIGRVEAASAKKVSIQSKHGVFEYTS
jgi:phosphoribosylformylglycinamidine cyclo-ligase